MALTTAVFVGKTKEWIPDLVEKVRKLKVGPGHLADTDIGPVISKESKMRIKSIIDESEKQGAKVLLDGRSVVVEKGYEKGNFCGATLLADVTVMNGCFCILKEEMVLACVIRS